MPTEPRGSSFTSSRRSVRGATGVAGAVVGVVVSKFSCISLYHARPGEGRHGHHIPKSTNPCPKEHYSKVTKVIWLRITLLVIGISDAARTRVLFGLISMSTVPI